MRTTQRQTAGQALDRGIVHRLLARTISAQRLCQKHRQRLGRWEQAFPMPRQQRLDLAQQFRTRQQVEKRIGIAVAGMASNSSLLLRARAGSKMQSGWRLREVSV